MEQKRFANVNRNKQKDGFPWRLMLCVSDIDAPKEPKSKGCKDDTKIRLAIKRNTPKKPNSKCSNEGTKT
ncbi:unnamed protein product [Dibothriocephalus latus]|uniref:Uncharacterized protein n=1 Tax=Dibothriocephalus latus TaxID=60516 RepID=A0A3P7S4E0_DIBLA|nr:unnamed protein product [Dibothriocephalus latus]